VARGLTSLNLEALGLPVPGTVEVQRFTDGEWQAVLGPMPTTGCGMHFTLESLEENSAHRLRLRTFVELDPLRFLFAKFAPGEAPQTTAERTEEQEDEEEEEEEEEEDDEEAPPEDEEDDDDDEEEEEEEAEEGHGAAAAAAALHS